MDFRTREIYTLLSPGEPIKIEKMGRIFELQTIDVPVGSIVYRADAGGAKSPSDAVPAFFSNNSSITVYKRGNEANVSKYRAIRDMRLFVMTVSALKTLFAFNTDLTAEDKEYLKLYLQKQSENAVMPIFPTRDQYRYLNRAIAGIVCRLGVDGWIVQPYEKGKTGMRDYSLVRPMADYVPELMICRWTDCMERIVEGGRKKLTKRRRRMGKRGGGTRGI